MTALAYVLYFRLLASAGATNLLLVTFLIPVSAVLLGFRRPENDHAEPSASLARLAAKSASTASWLRPWPFSIDARALSTLRPRYSL